MHLRTGILVAFRVAFTEEPSFNMITIKDTERSCVLKSFDGFVHKQYRGTHAHQRLENEVRCLSILNIGGVILFLDSSRLIEQTLAIIQSDCGVAVEHLVDWRLGQLFDSLHAFGVSHGDRNLRNVTYRAKDGRFCIVDFELAAIMEPKWSKQIDNLQLILKHYFKQNTNSLHNGLCP